MLPGYSQTLDDFGGVKINYAPVADPETDIDADEWNQLSNDVVMLGRMGCRAYVEVDPTADGYLSGCSAQWQNASTTYAPTVSCDSNKVWTITFPSTVVDELGNSKSLRLRQAWVSIAYEAGNTAYGAWVTLLTESTVEVRLHQANASPNLVKQTFTLFVV